MPIANTIEKPAPTVVLTPTEPLTVKSLSDAAAAVAAEVAKDPALQGTDPRIEWRLPTVALPEDTDWQNWARHYDTLAWQVASIFTAASVLLANSYVNARLNDADLQILRALAACGVGLILFQMFIVGAFRTYRYDLYKAEHRRKRDSRALDSFRKWTGYPWLVYCFVAWVAIVLWLYQVSYLMPQWDKGLVVDGIVAAVPAGVIGYWAAPPVLTK
jgi:hypothetical protein